MQKLLLVLNILVISITGFAQTDTTAPYYQNRLVPQFSLLSVDSIAFTQSVIETGKRTVFMLFDPECDHCQQQLEVLLSLPQFSESAQLIMVSAENPEKNKLFYLKNQLQNLPFVYVGTDINHSLAKFFRPATLPALIFYNKKNTFYLFHQGNADKKAILAALKKE